MTMPGFSTARLPMSIRLMLALAISMAILPLFWDMLYSRATGDSLTYVTLIFSETITGVMFGLIARFFVLGLEYTGTVIGMAISFNSHPLGGVMEDSQETALSSMLSFGALLLLFVFDFHHVIFTALADSYTAMPLGRLIDPQQLLITLTDTLSATFMVMLRLASPFILFGIMFNMVIGLINKLAPQIPVYFISTPYALSGGLLLLYYGIGALLEQFVDAFLPIYNNM